MAVTYVIGQYKPSVRIIDLVSHSTYVVCVNFIQKWRGTFSLKSTPKDRFFLRNFFMPGLITLRVFAEEILFVFCFDVWPGARTLLLYKFFFVVLY